jgi:hypothetical protein
MPIGVIVFLDTGIQANVAWKTISIGVCVPSACLLPTNRKPVFPVFGDFAAAENVKYLIYYIFLSE